MKFYFLQIQWTADKDFTTVSNGGVNSPTEFTVKNAEVEKERRYRDRYTRIIEVERDDTWYEIIAPNMGLSYSDKTPFEDFFNLEAMKRWTRVASERICAEASLRDNDGNIVYRANTIEVNMPTIDYYESGLTFEVGTDEERWSLAVQAAFRTEGKDIDLDAFRAIWEQTEVVK